MTEHQIASAERSIALAPEAVFGAITNPWDMQGWLCDLARLQPRVDGQVYLAWRDGAQAIGRVTKFQSPKELEWQLSFGRGEPDCTVSFNLSPQDSKTVVRVAQRPVAPESGDDARRVWVDRLECLASLVEDGVDLREARRPMLGIMPEELTAERAAERQIAAQAGLYLTGVTPGGGAEAAGLKSGDVIVALDGQPVARWDQLIAFLSHKRAGQVVSTAVVRGQHSIDVSIQLGGRPQPPRPSGPEEVAAEARRVHSRFQERLEQLLQGVTEREAEYRPAPGEWSVKEILAHLSSVERWDHDWIMRSRSGLAVDWLDWRESPDLDRRRLGTIIDAAGSLARLVERLAADQSETAYVASSLMPDEAGRRSLVRALALSVHNSQEHLDIHLEQIGATLAAARSAETE